MRYQISHKNSLGCEIADTDLEFSGSVEDANATLREYIASVDVYPGDTIRIVELGA